MMVVVVDASDVITQSVPVTVPRHRGQSSMENIFAATKPLGTISLPFAASFLSCGILDKAC